MTLSERAMWIAVAVEAIFIVILLARVGTLEERVRRMRRLGRGD